MMLIAGFLLAYAAVSLIVSARASEEPFHILPAVIMAAVGATIFCFELM